jgi:hypothetical protein
LDFFWPQHDFIITTVANSNSYFAVLLPPAANFNATVSIRFIPDLNETPHNPVRHLI